MPCNRSVEYLCTDMCELTWVAKQGCDILVRPDIHVDCSGKRVELWMSFERKQRWIFRAINAICVWYGGIS